MIKNILIFLGGIAIGGGASYAITKKVCEKEYSKGLEMSRAYYKAKLEEQTAFEPEKIVSESAETPNPEKPAKKEIKKKKPLANTPEAIVNNKKERDSLVKNIKDLEYAIDPALDEAPVELSSHITTISPDEFESSIGFEPVDLTYYNDGTLIYSNVELNTEEALNVEETIGSSVDDIGLYYPDVVHVKDHKLNKMYCVSYVDAPYYSIVVDDRGVPKDDLDE